MRLPPESTSDVKRWLWVHCPWLPRGKRARLATYRGGRFVMLGERESDPQLRLERIVHWLPAFGGVSAGEAEEANEASPPAAHDDNDNSAHSAQRRA